jgi:hypothetical protein
MPKLKPQARFLLRGSALLIGLLTLWWFVLLNPMLAVLEGSGSVLGSLVFGGKSGELITENPSGDWTFQVPLELTIPASPGQPVAQQVHSIDFDMPRGDVIAFTFSLPVFWAIAMAAPGLRRNLQPLIFGTLLMAGVELLLLLVFAEISAHKAAAQLVTGAQGAGLAWMLHFGEYLTVSVIPYAAPFVVALLVHRELRWQIFQWGSDSAVSPEASGNDRTQVPPRLRKQRRGRSA